MEDSLTYSQKLVGQPGWSGNNLIDRLARALGQGLGQAGLGGGLSGLSQSGNKFQKM